MKEFIIDVWELIYAGLVIASALAFAFGIAMLIGVIVEVCK